MAEHFKIGDMVDIGYGSQRIRFVQEKYSFTGRNLTTYELETPTGGTPLKTVSHSYIESFPEHRKKLNNASAKLAVLGAIAGGF